GGIAEVVGDLLGQLSDRVQVLCVTHLAQVACKGNEHLLVSKALADGGMSTRVDHLDDETRVEEIARMQGGRTITDSNRAHARELLNAS
ncbi:MAG: DNA repair protein RecN, partial [Cellvibrionales bacterium]